VVQTFELAAASWLRFDYCLQRGSDPLGDQDFAGPGVGAETAASVLRLVIDYLDFGGCAHLLDSTSKSESNTTLPYFRALS
jgi:hypothetical protein